MVIVKTLLILANSVKHGAHCIAGREVHLHEGQYDLGRWVRPISREGKGELRGMSACYEDGQPIRTLDFARVKMSGHAGDPLHREDWFIAPGAAWARSRDFQPPDLDTLVETPGSLWLEPRIKTDRIAHRALVARPPGQTICMIRPERLRFAFWTIEIGGEVKRRRRTRFVYNGVEYDLPLTDPAVTERLCPRYPDLGADPAIVRCLHEGQAMLCISLTPRFKDNHHYKVVATVINF